VSATTGAATIGGYSALPRSASCRAALISSTSNGGYLPARAGDTVLAEGAASAHRAAAGARQLAVVPYPQLDPVAVGALHAGLDALLAAGQPRHLTGRGVVEAPLVGAGTGKATLVRLAEQLGEGAHSGNFARCDGGW
jgi:hypothetical protein